MAETLPYGDPPQPNPSSGLAANQPTETVAAVDPIATGALEAIEPEVAQVGDYRLEGKLGEGGMATVYRAVHVVTGQVVALKRIKESARGDKQLMERFVREVSAASRLDHENVCRVFAGGDVQTPQGREVFMAVELVDGGDLSQLLTRMGGKLPAAAAALVIEELLRALVHAHERGVIHRDIKPQNVMITRAGVVKLVDFGIARHVDDQKLTATGLVVGTPAYMSPEQVRGMPIDARSDLFTTGVMLTELLTGKNPFLAETATATVLRILGEPVPPLFSLDPTIPGVLQKVAADLLERDPDRRTPLARAALDDLAPYCAMIRAQFPGDTSAPASSGAPNLLALCLEDPARARRLAVSQQAAFEMDRASDLASLGEPGLPAAALAAFRATRLEPDSQVALARFRELCAKGGFDFAPQDPRIVDVETELARAWRNPALLRRAADLHRASKNPHGQVDYLGRYLQLQPGDELSERQWRAITTGPLDERPQTRVKLSTREIVDGIRTGGWKTASLATASAAVLPGPPVTGLFDDVRASTRAPTMQSTRVGATVGADGRRPSTARRADGPVVVVGGTNESAGSGKLVAAVVGVLVIAVVAGLLSLAKRGAEGTNAAFAAAASAGDPAAGVRTQIATHLDAARAALAKGDHEGALFAANIALNLAPTNAADVADAHYLRATAYAGIGKKPQALDALTRFFEVAPLRHRDHHAAKALEAELMRPRNGGAPTTAPELQGAFPSGAFPGATPSTGAR